MNNCFIITKEKLKYNTIHLESWACWYMPLILLSRQRQGDTYALEASQV